MASSISTLAEKNYGSRTSPTFDSRTSLPHRREDDRDGINDFDIDGGCQRWSQIGLWVSPGAAFRADRPPHPA
jgi:hypothetical protein